MIEPATVPLTAWRNADYAETFIVAESFDAAGNAVNPLDLTGYGVELQVRLYGLAGGSALITASDPVSGSEDRAVVLEADGGQIEVFISTETLEALPAASKEGGDAAFAYDLVLTDPDGVTSVYAQGPFTVKPGVTR